MTRDKARSYDAGVLGKLVENEKGSLKISATELSDYSIRMIVFVTDDKLKSNIWNMLHVNPILPPIKDPK